ncbi:hypothetical protein T440DRAFT_469520 [Plenodomus tracheiphilus IPT5]|uniref:F-box domain-containing protein n=1 Tax=Plenodomus tracheiphilus IPT5 TaxID=1408161 RepID=A0A6A7B0L8_9PLEO|nr:hypothetical protein T440DRAFT_469520 [Plenodomus tracheiphilus IPT5]
MCIPKSVPSSLSSSTLSPIKSVPESTMATLLTMPLELLVAVSTHISTSDLASLRLTCKQVEKSLYEWFSEEFFTKKQFMLTHPSLQALIDISKHVGFSKKLKHVIIATNVYRSIPLRFRDEHAAARYAQGYEAQEALLSTGIDREMLTEAFQNLVNLHTVGIRDFNAPSRLRDGQHATWTSWGATTVMKETGMELCFYDRNGSGPERGGPFLCRVFSTVNYALGKAGRTPPELEVLLRKAGLPDITFSLPDFLLSSLVPVLNNYTSLLLNVDLTLNHLHTHTGGTIVETHAGHSLRQFLSFTPNLTHLRLNFQKSLVVNNTDFLDWLGQSVPIPGQKSANHLSIPPTTFPLLKTLELGQLKILPDTLLAVIAKFAPSLHSISLWRMALCSRSLPPQGHKPSYWAELLRRMGKIPQLNLNHLKVGMVQQDYMYAVSMHVNFKKEEDSEGIGSKQVEYHGKNMDKFLDSLIGRVNVEWPKEEEVVSSGEDSDDSMADPDHEDDDSEDEYENDNDEGSDDD